MKVFEYLLHYNLGYTVRIKRKELTLKRPYFLKWAQFFNWIALSFSFISVEITVPSTHESFQSGCSLVVVS